MHYMATLAFKGLYLNSINRHDCAPTETTSPFHLPCMHINSSEGKYCPPCTGLHHLHNILQVVDQLPTTHNHAARKRCQSFCWCSCLAAKHTHMFLQGGRPSVSTPALPPLATDVLRITLTVSAYRHNRLRVTPEEAGNAPSKAITNNSFLETDRQPSSSHLFVQHLLHKVLQVSITDFVRHVMQRTQLQEV